VFSGIAVNEDNTRVAIDEPGSLPPNNFIYDFSRKGLDTVRSWFDLPDTPTDNNRVLNYERSSVRVAMLDELAAMFKKPEAQRSAYEKAIVNGYEKLMRNFRIRAAKNALREYDSWDPPILNATACFGKDENGNSWESGETCYGNVSGKYPSCDEYNADGTIALRGYRPPSIENPPEGYDWQARCVPTGQIFGSPSVDAFRSYGYVRAQHDVTQSVDFFAANIAMSQRIGILVGLGAAVVLGAVLSTATLLVVSISLTWVYTWIAFASGGGFFNAHLISAGAAGGGLLALPILAMLLEYVGIIMLVIQLVDAYAIRPALLEDLADARNEHKPVQTGINSGSDETVNRTWNELYIIFLDSTLPETKDLAKSPIPAPAPNAPRFVIKNESGNIIATRAEFIEFVAPDQQANDASKTAASVRLDGGWFVPKFYMQELDEQGVFKNDPNAALEQRELLTLSIIYLDWDGKRKVAWRKGNSFLILDPGTAGKPFSEWAKHVEETNVLKYKTPEGVKLQASIASTDLTAPEIEANITAGTLGDNGWYRSDVTVTFTCSDDVDPNPDCTSPITLSNEGENQTATGTATDSAGNTATASKTVSIDQTDPACRLTIPFPRPEWFNSTNAIRVTCTDSPSGLADPSQASFSLIPEVEGGNITATVDVFDKAGNSTRISETFSFDRTPPTIVIASPEDGASYALGEVVTAQWTVSDAVSGVDLASVQGTVPLGAAINTSSVGEKAFAVTAKDVAGNVSSVTVHYLVLTPLQSAEDLLEKTQTLTQTSELKKNLSRCLLALLANAVSELPAVEGVNNLIEFINIVNAQKGEELTNAEADFLLARAQAILNALSGGPQPE